MVAKDEPGGLGPAQPPGDRHRPLHPRPPRLLQLRRLFQIFTDRKNGQLERGSNRLNLKFITLTVQLLSVAIAAAEKGGERVVAIR